MELANGRPRGTRMVHVCIRRTKHGTGLLVVRRVDGLGRETTLWKISFSFLGKNKLWKVSEMANTDSEEHNDELDSSPISISRQKQLTRHAKHCKCCPHFSRAKLNMHACMHMHASAVRHMVAKYRINGQQSASSNVRGWPIRHMEFLGKYAFQFPRLKSWRSTGAYSIYIFS